MGFSASEIEFVGACSRAGVSFERTLLLGRQRFFSVTAVDLGRMLDDYAVHVSEEQAASMLREQDGFVEPMFDALGASSVDSLDASEFEGATICHDLNTPMPADLDERFTVVIDGGTLEHVFNVPQALSNAMRMVEVSGHLISMTPCNNEAGHGFFQFSPEFYFRALSPENGYRIERFVVRENEGPWYEAIDPAEIGQRLEYRSRRRVYSFVVAKREAAVLPFEHWPQQSDYSSMWAGSNRGESPSARGALPALLARSRTVRRHVLNLRARYYSPAPFARRRRHFKRVRHL